MLTAGRIILFIWQLSIFLLAKAYIILYYAFFNNGVQIL